MVIFHSYVSLPEGIQGNIRCFELLQAAHLALSWSWQVPQAAWDEHGKNPGGSTRRPTYSRFGPPHLVGSYNQSCNIR